MLSLVEHENGFITSKPADWSRGCMLGLFPLTQLVIMFNRNQSFCWPRNKQYYCEIQNLLILVSNVYYFIQGKYYISNDNGKYDSFDSMCIQKCGQWQCFYLLTSYWSLLIDQNHLEKWASTRENLPSEVCEQKRRRQACASAQSDQRLCYSLNGKYHI